MKISAVLRSTWTFSNERVSMRTGRPGSRLVKPGGVWPGTAALVTRAATWAASSEGGFASPPQEQAIDLHSVTSLQAELQRAAK